ncbi:MAG: GAF domain-containing protein [Candidatus Marinimicrobia bacterium]|nr:GAF domain-containing protein [Candidatus Neomarinimicrobiota bacterium]
MDKSTRYKTALALIKSFIGSDGYPMTEIGKMASITSILHREFTEWPFVGFYRTIKDGVLEIGPYHGSVLACGIINFGKGVCGTAAETQKTLIVDNVYKYPGYISCDSDTRSEIVVPIIRIQTTVAVLDIDAVDIGYFDDIDQRYLEEIVSIL